MAGKRCALLIASYKYNDPELRELIAPEHDVKSLERILRDPNIGNFNVQMSINDPYYIVNEHIEEFFAQRSHEDMLLLYFSGHGVKDEDGKLYFAASNTNREKLHTTAIPATLIHDLMRCSRSRRQVLILDCCYSGAFTKGMRIKGEDRVGIQEFFKEGKGYAILSASDSLQYSFEADGTDVPSCSIFTENIIHGLKTGEADLNKDGVITVNEVYDYVRDIVLEKTPHQQPKIWADAQGDMILAWNPEKDNRPLVKDALYESDMIRIPAGSFLLGSTNCESERPPHYVDVQTFSIGRYPVTNSEYRIFVQEGGEYPSHWRGPDDPLILDDHPVTWISWYDALAYCRWFSEKTGMPYRLPSEAEWEKAAGWDPQSECKRLYPWGDDWNKSYCNSRQSTLMHTTPVDKYAPYGESFYGVADLVGNIWEWCSSQFTTYPYEKDDGRENLHISHDRVLRGGSFATDSDSVHCTARIGCHPRTRERGFGFRVALSVGR